MSLVYQDLLAHQEMMVQKEKREAALVESGKRQYDYDSDEDTKVQQIRLYKVTPAFSVLFFTSSLRVVLSGCPFIAFYSRRELGSIKLASLKWRKRKRKLRN